VQIKFDEQEKQILEITKNLTSTTSLTDQNKQGLADASSKISSLEAKGNDVDSSIATLEADLSA